MTCPEEDALFALVRGALPEERAAAIAAHADGCVGCQMALGEVARLAALGATQREAPALEAGAVLAGRFRLRARLGEGGAGVVWSADALDGSGPVALKLLRASMPDSVRRLLREARLAAALSHPNLVTVREVLTFEDRPPALVTPLLEGEPLSARFARGALAPAEARALLRALADAVAALHAVGIVHRDVKPSNVLLVGGSPRLLDLGLAKQLRGGPATRPTTAGKLLGTPRYMAPEQLVAAADVDEKADVWALGAILYEALAGRPHVDAQRPAMVMKVLAAGIPPLVELAPNAPPDLVALATRMLRPDRRERPTAADVARHL